MTAGGCFISSVSDVLQLLSSICQGINKLKSKTVVKVPKITQLYRPKRNTQISLKVQLLNIVVFATPRTVGKVCGEVLISTTDCR